MAKDIISNLKLTINSDSLSNEIIRNNIKISLDVKSDIIIVYELLDLYYNSLNEIESVSLSENNFLEII